MQTSEAEDDGGKVLAINIHDGILLSTNVDGKAQAFVHLLGGGKGKLSMNALFGDPCPGTSKRLHIHYTVTEMDTTNIYAMATARVETHQVSFAEHEQVVLRRGLAILNCATTGRRLNNVGLSCAALPSDEMTEIATTTQEVTVPLILPFLELRERVRCCAISSIWRRIIRGWGVATVIDANDPDMMGSGNNVSTGPHQHHHLSPTVFRGLVTHSYTSLHSLFLSGFEQLEQDDLHPALPHLRALKSLDVTRCAKLDDSTMKLVAEHLSGTLQVLYLKGLYLVTDVGIQAICQSCVLLEVLDVSQIMNLSDTGGTAIQNLKELQALFFRDNYKLSNVSLDAITPNCVKLQQLTLWGLIGIQRLKFNDLGSGKLTMLNLWGCHNLGKELPQALESMSLSSLVLSECQQLSDDFIMAISKIPSLHNLRHLHLRYLIRMSDASLVAISKTFRSLFSLDLSFCSGISAIGIYQLLNQCRDHLVELRLKSILTLDIAYSSKQNTNERDDRRDHAGHWILNALRPIVHTNVDHTLCVLDVRLCGGQRLLKRPYDKNDQFVVGMSKLHFEQQVPGFFRRSASIVHKDLKNH